MGAVVRSPLREHRSAALDVADRLSSTAVISLELAAVAGPAVVGAKAANLGRAAAMGLPVLPGFVLTTRSVELLSSGRDVSRRIREELTAAWCVLSDNGRRPVVVRSSSPVEDQAGSSMAGRFSSVVGVAHWSAFQAAVDTVVRSALLGGTGSGAMAVLVQPHLEPRLSGVMFGLDPMTGRTDRLVVVAVEGGPQALVSGEVDGSRYLLGPRGRLVEGEGPRLPLHRRDRRALAALAGRAAALFGGPQDVEWAFATDGRLWLLQARPVTAIAPPAGGPLLGPGPMAETFPDPLDPLEEDLWLPPLRRAIAESLRLTGSASRRRLARSPIVVTVGGRVAADLELLGSDPTPATWWSRVDPRPPLRRLRAAWTVGRLRAALPALAGDITAAVDAELVATPALEHLDDDRLLLLLDRAAESLTSLHGHEMLAGLLPPSPLTAAGLALDALTAGRAAGLEDADIIAAWPVVLALRPPALTGGSPFPTPVAAPMEPARNGIDLDGLGPREALRLRARWVHELTRQAALELGLRLTARGVLGDRRDVGLLTRTELEAAVRHGVVPIGIDARRRPLSPPLPAAFRLAGDRPVPVPLAGKRRSPTGRGASPGRAAGVAYQGPLPAPPGSVLVVATLDPGLAPHLGRLAGVVAETGSALSHLAILARELGVPCVVGHTGARDRFPSGTALTLDGTTGEVAPFDGGSR
ncbi:MAG: PEP/pyruvate-binding domain-containing protein [Actinomycetota bacterium]|jgi:rifampicin phosphotransferase